MRYSGISIAKRKDYDSVTSLDVDSVDRFFNHKMIKSTVKLPNDIVYAKIKDDSIHYCKIPEHNPLFNYWILEALGFNYWISEALGFKGLDVLIKSADPIVYKQLTLMLK